MTSSYRLSEATQGIYIEVGTSFGAIISDYQTKLPRSGAFIEIAHRELVNVGNCWPFFSFLLIYDCLQFILTIS